MDVTLALAGDTMLGRQVGERLRVEPPERFVAPEVVAVMAEADIRIVNLECCIAESGEPWPDPAKPFFFRAPPAAVELLAHLGADAVTLANNHALDFGTDALLETLDRLDAAAIAHAGAGRDEVAARAPAHLSARDMDVALLAVTDHPAEFAATPERPGVAYADLAAGAPDWLKAAIADAESDAVLVAPHWGPNMARAPRPATRAAAAQLVAAGATLVAGHSAHVFHGVEGRVLYDLGDFLDDYRRDPLRRNDLGILALVTLTPDGPRRLEAVPLKLEHCRTRLATGLDARWIHRRLRHACAALGTDAHEEDCRLVITW